VMRGKTNPPNKLLDAVAMQSATRAITQQTLTRMKEIATGEVTEGAKEAKPGKAAARKSAGVKTASGKKVPSSRTAGRKTAEKKPAGNKTASRKKA